MQQSPDAMQERISELEQQLALLRQERDNLRITIQGVHDAIIAVDSAFRIQSWNAGAERLYGWKAEETIGKNIDTTLQTHFALDTDREQALKEVLANGFWHGQVVQVHRDQHELYIDSSVRLVYDGQGNLSGMVAVNRETGERARVSLDTVFEQIPAGMALYDTGSDWRCIRHNSRFLEFVGQDWQKKGSIVGVPMRDLFDEATGQDIETIFAHVLATGEAFAIDDYAAVLLPDPRPRYYQWSLTPIRNPWGVITALMVSAQEITKLKRAQELERQLQATQRLESLGVLAGGIAHDFNNLLVAILGNAELALLDLAPESLARRTVEQISQAAHRAAELTQQLLAYAGKGRFAVQRLDLNAIVEEMLQILRTSVPSHVQVQANLTRPLPSVEADATQLRQIVMNLVMNAAEAIGEQKGRIVIRSGSIWADQIYLREQWPMNELVEGTYVFLDVSDTGKGMDVATQERIFEPFFTTKVAGRGLGLSAVLGIVRSHKGALRVYSEEGKGSLFKLLLPGVDEAAEMVPSLPQPHPFWHGQGLILVIDDDTEVQVVIMRMLERLGFSVVAAADGREGLATFQVHRASIVCVLIDLTMPQMNGVEVFQQIRMVAPEIPVIIMSGYNKQEVADRLTGIGLTAFLQKPFTPTELQHILHYVLTS
jgi:PAS domain S-box-containing protein